MSKKIVGGTVTTPLNPEKIGGSGGGVLCVTATITSSETVDGVQTLTGTADKTYEEILAACNAGQSVLLHADMGVVYAIIPLVAYNRHELLFNYYLPAADNMVGGAITSDNSLTLQISTMASRINSLIDAKLGVIENGTY